MTTSSVLIINPRADFEEQTNAVRNLLQLATDGVLSMDGCFTPAVAEAVSSIHTAVVGWLDHNLADELARRSARRRPALQVAAE
jgi:hypothetical protein